MNYKTYLIFISITRMSCTYWTVCMLHFTKTASYCVPLLYRN